MDTSDKMKEAREKLFSKFKNNNVRGKNIPRRKVKRKNANLGNTRKKTKMELDMIKCIQRINKYLNELEKKDQEMCEVAEQELEDLFYFYFEDTSKFEYNSKKLYKQVKEDVGNFILCNLFEKRVILDCYSVFKKYFIHDCFEDLLDLLRDLDNYMEKERYKELFEECEEDVDEISLDNCYKMLDLDINETYTKKQVIKAYRKKAFLYHPDKHEDNEKEKYAELFKDLNKHYRFLLKSLIMRTTWSGTRARCSTRRRRHVSRRSGETSTGAARGDGSRVRALPFRLDTTLSKRSAATILPPPCARMRQQSL